MYYDAVDVRYIAAYKLELVFENGKKGIVKQIETFARGSTNR